MPVSLTVGVEQDGTRSFSLGLCGAKAGNFELVIDAEKAARKCVEYLYTCLSLPDDALWVNLKPGARYSIIDADLSRTDLGRILLAADLRLKKDVSELTNPRTVTGREYWNRLYRRAEELGVTRDIPVNSRVWVGAGDIAVHERNGGIEIVKSELRVYMQTEEVVIAAEPRLRQLQEYACRLMQELIVPALQVKVNSHYAYWEVRQVFRAMILARWYKRGGDAFPKDNLAWLNSDITYGAEDVYADYLDSLKRGEYSVSETGRRKIDLFLHLITRNYVSGGMDFRRVSWRAARRENADAVGTVRFSCAFCAEGGDVRAAQRSLELAFPWPGISPDLFDKLPPLGTIKNRVEENMHKEQFQRDL